MSRHRPPDLYFCYSIQLSYQLRDVEGFLRLKGAVIDTSANMLKSYLLSWPKTACEFLHNRASDPSMTHPR
jgi:hypothetical protein